MIRRLRAAALAMALVVAGSAAQAAPATQATAEACVSSGVGTDSFCTVRGVRIHFVDWGGQGPAVILLAGLGSTARVFDDLGPRMAQGHRVLALTRRGYGQSDRGQADYSNPALVGDILGVMDGLGLAKASFVGHSLAGGELSTLGAQHPSRVERLVYLDAAYDRTRALDLTNAVPAGASPQRVDLASLAAYAKWREEVLQSRSPAVAHDAGELVRMAPSGVVPRTAPPVMLQILAGDVAAGPQYERIVAPALAVYASKDVADQVPPRTSEARRAEIVEYFRRHIRPWMLRAQADFIERKACGVAVELPRSTHHFFLRSPKAAAALIRDYLAAPDPCAWRARPPANATW